MVVKNLPAKAGEVDLIPELGRSPGGGKGNPLQYSCLGNPMDRKAVATGLEKVSFHSNPKKGNAKKCSNYCTTALISHASKVMLKILQSRLQQYVNREIPDVQAGFRKAEEPEIKLPTSLDHGKSKRVPEKHLFLLY